MLELNNVAVHMPRSFKVSTHDLDGNSTRNAKGDMIRDRKAVKRRLELEWSALKQSEIQQILNAVSPVFFPVKYLDPQLGLITKTFYVGDRTTPMLRYWNGVPMWNGLSFNLIER